MSVYVYIHIYIYTLRVCGLLYVSGLHFPFNKPSRQCIHNDTYALTYIDLNGNRDFEWEVPKTQAQNNDFAWEVPKIVVVHRPKHCERTKKNLGITKIDAQNYVNVPKKQKKPKFSER